MNAVVAAKEPKDSEMIMTAISARLIDLLSLLQLRASFQQLHSFSQRFLPFRRR